MIPSIIAISECILTNSLNPISFISQFILIKHLSNLLIHHLQIHPLSLLSIYFIINKIMPKDLFSSKLHYNHHQFNDLIINIDTYINSLYNQPNFELSIPYILELQRLQYLLNVVISSNAKIYPINAIITCQQRISYIHKLLPYHLNEEPFFQEIQNNFPSLNINITL